MHSVVCAAIYIVYYTEMQNVTDLYQFNAIFSNCAKVLNLHAFLQVKFGFKRMCICLWCWIYSCTLVMGEDGVGKTYVATKCVWLCWYIWHTGDMCIVALVGDGREPWTAWGFPQSSTHPPWCGGFQT